jgi:NitT/TauT family transport system substrate-binding protein
MIFTRSRILTSIIVLCLLLPSICLGVNHQGNRFRPLRALLTPFISFAPFFIAEEEGYFAEQGLKVQPVNLDDATKAVPALMKGDLDIVGGTLSVGMLNMMAKGSRMRIVADKGYIHPSGCDHFALLARTDFLRAGKMADPLQLKGKKVAVKLARTTEYFLELILKRVGLTMSEIEVANIPDDMMLQAFKNGNIDLAVTAEPWITRVLDTGLGAVWVPASQILPDFQIAITLFGPNLLEKDPVAGQKFMMAYLKAVRQYGKGKTKRNLDIMAKHTGLTQEFLNRCCWAPIREDGQINLRSMLDFQSWAVARRYLPMAADKEQLWEPRFAADAHALLLSQPGRSK